MFIYDIFSLKALLVQNKITDKDIYYNGDNITVGLKLHINQPNVYDYDNIKITEYISDVFNLIASSPQPPNYEIRSSNHDNYITWTFRDISTLRTNISGPHTLGTTSLKTKSRSRSPPLTVLFPSPSVSIINRPPIIDLGKVPPKQMWLNDNYYILAYISDPDGDNVSCDLYLDGIKSINPIITKKDRIRYKYIWDLSACEVGSHDYFLKASDNESEIKTNVMDLDVQDKFLWFIPITNESAIRLLSSFIVGILTTCIVIFREDIRDKIKNVINKLK